MEVKNIKKNQLLNFSIYIYTYIYIKFEKFSHNTLTFTVRLDTVENLKLKLKTEKYCSKIIFKCVNSTLRLILNEKVVEM